jgi:formylglycine-generating enzyme required for sulfatase activity
MPRNHDVRVYAKLTAARARAARSLYSGDVERLGQIAKQTERWKGRSSSHGLMLSVLQTMGMEEFTDLVGISTLLQSEMLNEREMKIADFWRSSGYQILQKCAKQISELAPKEAMRYRQVAEELAPELWKMERVAELYKEGTSSSVVDSDPKRALALLEEAQSLGRNLCDPAFDKWLEYVKDQVGKAEKAVRFAELYKEGTSSVVDSDPKRALALLEEAKILDEDLCDSTFHTLLKDVKQKVSSPSPLEPSSKEQIIELSQSKEIIDRYRPTTLPERVSRGACHFSIELPQKKGALVDLPTLPEGLEQRWIITPQGTPLIEMVKIPAGKAKFGEEKRELELEEYWIARTPVTNLMWLQFVKESQYQPTSDDHDGEYLKHWQDDQPPEELLEHPVVNVSYINAWAFCDYNGLSLPSEAQWEKAARGTNGRTYPWGNQPEPNGELCNFNSPISTTTPVNKYPDGASLYGLLDCAGNVREWCADEYQSNWLDIIANANTRHIICSCNNYADSTFALRGGSFDVMAEDVQCAARYRIKARNCFINFGFRPVFPRT